MLNRSGKEEMRVFRALPNTAGAGDAGFMTSGQVAEIEAENRRAFEAEDLHVQAGIKIGKEIEKVHVMAL